MRVRPMFLMFGLAGLLAASLSDARAQQRPTRIEIWDLKLGTAVTDLPDEFTDYACGSELDHFEENGFDVNSASDCYSFQNILAASLWKGGEHSEQIRRLAYRALWDSLNAERDLGWKVNPWVWVISFRRAAA